MKLTVVDDAAALGALSAEWMTQTIAAKPTAAMVLAMGNTPLGAYREIAELHRRGEIDLSQVQVFQLDGYLGLTADDPRSLERWLRQSVVEPWGIREEQVVRLAEDGVDPDAVCQAYVERVRAVGGFDLAILGLGPNGHLGFNEPPSGPDAPTRVVALTEASIQSNAGYWGAVERVPRQSITAGMDLLLAAKQIVLLVTGEHKRDILRQTLHGPVTEDVPASWLQRHPNVIVIADKAACPDGHGDI